MKGGQTMKKYEVVFAVNGRKTGSVTVEAKDGAMAKRTALGILCGKAGYVGKKITVWGWRKI